MTVVISAPVGPTVASGSGGGASPDSGGGSLPGGARFFESPRWRTLITDMPCAANSFSQATIIFLDRRMFSRSASYVLDGPATFSGSVASDDPKVNRIYDGDGKDDPAVAEGTRLLYCFRQEDPTGLIPWSIRFSGPILQLTDRTDSDRPVTDILAYDPWQYLYSIPVVTATGETLGPNGLNFIDTRGSDIAATLLFNALLNLPDMLNLIDAGTVFWGGTIEDTAKISNWHIDQGRTLGEAWDDLVATQSMDIMLTPIYDPINRPGICVELSIFAQAGNNRFNAVFGWDKFTGSLTELTRLKDGTSRANTQDWHAGQGGPSVGTLTDATAVAKYGAYWRTQFVTSNPIKTSVALIAQQQLQLEKNGRETLTLRPAPERGPFPFTEWYLGDCIFPYASTRFRQAVDSSVGAIVMSNIAAAGAGYAEGDTGTVSGGGANAGYVIDAVGGGGAVQVYRIVSIGSGYTTAEGVSTSTGGTQPGAGAGLTLNIGTGQRVYGFAVDISDEGVETITPALVSPS